MKNDEILKPCKVVLCSFHIQAQAVGIAGIHVKECVLGGGSIELGYGD